MGWNHQPDKYGFGLPQINGRKSIIVNGGETTNFWGGH